MNPLYEFISNLKERINKGEISGHTALDLFYQRISTPSEITSAEYIPEPPPADNDHVAEGCELCPEPVPEPASESPADGQTADAETE